MSGDLSFFSARAVLDAAQESILITDAELDRPGPRIIYINAAGERMFGYAPGELIGQTPRIFQGPATDHGIFANFRTILKSGEAWRGQTVNYRKDGSPFDLEWTIAPLAGADGQVRHYLSVQRDVSRRVQAERLVHDALVHAQAGEKAKAEFLAVMTHELRSPLNAIIGFAEIMHSEVMGPLGNPRYRDYAATIERSGRTLLNMVSEILDYARTSTGAAKLTEEPVVLNDLAGETLAMFGPEADKRGLTLALESATGVAVKADRHRLGRVLQNLIGNAVKFNRPGGTITVRLTAGPRAEAAPIEIAVIDDGPGVPEGQKQKIFDPFYQIDPSLKRRQEGVGLGLAIVQQLVELHGGAIALSDTPGGGATFTVTLPAERRIY